MFSFRAWLRRLAYWAATIKRPVRARRGRRRGRWFSRGRGPRGLRLPDPYRWSAGWPFERLEPRVVLDSVSWIGPNGAGGSGNWDVAANWLDSTTSTNRVPTSGDTVTINTASAATINLLPGDSEQVANLILDSNDTLNFTLDGTRAGTDYGVLDVTGTGDFTGPVSATFNGYTPGADDSFQPLLYGPASTGLVPGNVSVPSGEQAFVTGTSLYVVPSGSGSITVTTAADDPVTPIPNQTTLRDAINEANGSTNPVELIEFDIPTTDGGYNVASGVWTITADTALPAVSAHAIIDATSQPGYAGKPVVQLTQASPGLINSYDGLAAASEPGGPQAPPDTQGAAGPDSFVEVVNQAIAIYPNRSTSAGAVSDSLADFFSSNNSSLYPAPSGNKGLIDPDITWDEQIQRFIVGDDNPNNGSGSSFELAVSTSPNPATLTSADWNFFQVNTTESGYTPDYPGNLGWNHDALVFTLNMYGSNPSDFHVQIDSIDINALLNGTPLTSSGVNANLFQTDDTSAASLRPTVMHDSQAGDPMWFVEEHPYSFAQGASNASIDVIEMTGVLSANPMLTTTTLSVNPYYTAVPILQPGGSTSDELNANNIYSPILKAAMQNGEIVAAQQVSDSAGDLDEIQWYVIDTNTTTTGTPSIAQQGDLSGGPGAYYTYPSIDINPQGDIGMTYMATTDATGGQYMSTYITGRAPTDTPGTMDPPVLVQAGQALSQDNGRAGDLAGINVDSNGFFWISNEFATNQSATNSGGNVSWGTAIADFAVGAVNASVTEDGLDLTGGNSRVSGLDINGFSGDGINIFGAGDDTITANYLGTDPTGTTAMPNGGNGISISGVANNVIGGGNAGDGNVISGNQQVGVVLSGSGTTGNTVEDNLIGTDVSGANKLPNTYDGLDILSGASSNTVAGNTISGNASGGVTIAGFGAVTSQNILQGNFIGTDPTGTIDVGNTLDGVTIESAATDNQLIGNVISGNEEGVYIANSGTTGNLVQSNLIGTNLAGTAAIGNVINGVHVDAGADGNTIGPGNVISGNESEGVEILSNGNWVEGNFIGTDATGATQVHNGQYGVLLTNGASGNTIGTKGTDGANDKLEGNVISGNILSGVGISGIGTNRNSISGNKIGTDSTGENPVPNGNNGVAIFGGAQQNVVGTQGITADDAGQGNVISGNNWSGVGISDDGTDDNLVAGNYIGVDAKGTTGLGNGNNGVSIFGGAQQNVIGVNGDGNDDVAKRNVISGNTWQGVYIDSGSDNNTVAGNLIGLDKTGAVKLGNVLNGIQALSAGNTIGGPLAVEANTVSGNAQAGVQLFGEGSEYLSNAPGGLTLGLGDGSAISQPASVASTAPITGGAGQALSFDGANTKAQTGATGAMNSPTLTLEAWVKPNLRPDAPQAGPPNALFYPDNVISNDLPGDNGRGFGVNVWSGGSQLTVEYEDGFRIVPNFTFNANTWYHIAVVYIPAPNSSSQATVDSYVNGSLVDSFQYNEGNDNAANFIRIGYHNDDAGSYGTTRFFDGLLDNVSVWNVDRTASDIAGDMNSDLTGSETGLAAFWSFDQATTGNLVEGNYIGTNSTGTSGLGNGSDGIDVFGGNNTIGGGAAADRNVISANGNWGVEINGSTAANNSLLGNYIGLAADGKTMLGNAYWGVDISDAPNNNIGGTASGDGNVISGNDEGGIFFYGAHAAGNQMLGNLIGTDAGGTLARGNSFSGVIVTGSANDNTIGGATSGAANVIAANVNFGVWITGAGATNNQVLGNDIGTNAAGTPALGNAIDGVRIDSGATGNTVGGTAPAAANVIRGNSANGVTLAGSGTTGNVILGNTITANAVAGIDVTSGAGSNTIGGDASGDGNLISANGNAGVILAGAGSTVVQGNTIGTDSAGATAMPNAADGILVSSPNNTIGGTDTLARNLISGNTGSGVEITGPAATGNTVEGNFIGTDVSGAKALGNTLDGVQVDSGANGNNVANNVISANNGSQPLPGGTSWTAVGPAPIIGSRLLDNVGTDSGRITGVAPDPANADVVYIAAASGGVWKTTNATATTPTWTPLTDNLTDPTTGNPLPLFMGAIAETDATSGPNSGQQIVYAGTGEANNKHSNYGDGILVSTDGGKTWTVDNPTTAQYPNGVFTRLAVAKIAIDPSDTTGMTAFAAISGFAQTGVAGGENNGLGGNTGIWKTTDGGKTWTNMTAQANSGISDTSDSYSDVVIDPNNGQIVYAAIGNFQGAAANGIYKSTDGGNTWSLLSGFPNGTADGRISIAISADSTTLYAAASTTGPTGSSNLSKFEKSTDGGSTWTDVTANILGQTGDFTGGQAFYDMSIAVDPSNASIVYAAGSLDFGGVGMIQSTDGGATWHNITADDTGNGPHTDWHALTFDANGHLLVGNDGGLWRKDPDPSNSAGFLWIDLNGNLNTVQLASTALDPVDPAIAIGGSQDNGTEVFTGGPAWTETDGGDGGEVKFDPQNPAVVYSASPVALSFGPAAFFRVSTDRGATWTAATNGLNVSADADAMNNYPTFAVAPSNGSEVILGDQNLWITTNAAQSWTELAAVSTSTNNNGWNPNGNQVDAIAIAASNANTIYASTGGDFAASSQIFVSTNGGTNWSEIDLPAGSGRVGQLAVDPTNSQIVYAVVNRFTGGAGHVWRSTNGGTSWTDITGTGPGALPDEPTNTVAINTTTGALYVGNDTGVYVSTNFTSGSPTWALLAPGMPNAPVSDLEYNATFSLLSAATFGRGAYFISTGGTSVTGAGVFIDATSSGNTLTGNLIGTDHTGTDSLPNANGVEVLGPSNTIGGTTMADRNVISGNAGDGILISGTSATSNVVEGNFIGTDLTGTASVPNGSANNYDAGVAINNSTGNTIGGTTAGARNLISGNGSASFPLVYGVTIAGGGSNVVEGDYIGVDVSGAKALGNARSGIDIGSSANNTIGGTATGAGNVISANGESGVFIQYAQSSGNVVEGNLIGTDYLGTTALGGNSLAGVTIDGAPGNTVGGTTTAARNIISGNAGPGVLIGDFAGTGQATANVVEGNYIGTDVTGGNQLGNTASGVLIESAAYSNTIGGTAAGAGNVISGNTSDGVDIAGTGTTGNVVLGNEIGTDHTGTKPLGNGNEGVAIFSGAAGNTIGGTVTASANVISANNGDGLLIETAGTSQNVVEGNFIGTDISGKNALGNVVTGVTISDGATNNTIGGAATGAGNVISGNKYDGIRIMNAGTSGNVVLGNEIGANLAGSQALGNGYDGVEIFGGAAGNVIGGTATGAHNVISGNAFNGVDIHDSGTSGNTVLGNEIGTDITGEVAIANDGTGVDVSGAAGGNTIGGDASGDGNLISANHNAGVILAGAGSNVVQDNFIGTDKSGGAAMPNAGGIFIASPSNTIGGTDALARNIISGNAGAGVELSGATATGNVVQGNYIGTDVTGAKALGNTLDGVQIADGASGNNIETNVVSANGGASLPGSASWTAIGPAPLDGGYSDVGGDSGRIDGVAADPTNADIVYIAAAGGGVWKTTNATAASPTWTPVTDNIKDANGNPVTIPIFMGAVAVAPSNPSVIYAGTGEANSGADAGYGSGILVSTDGGATWTLENPGGDFTHRSIAKIAVDPTDPKTAYAAVSISDRYGNLIDPSSDTNMGIWKTTDGGATWTNVTAQVNSGINDTADSYTDVVVDPNNHLTVYAAIGYFYGSSDNGVYKSTDGGMTWTLLNDSTFPSGTVNGRIALAISTSNAQGVLYAIVSANSNTPGSPPFGSLYKIEKSTDGGATWSDVTSNATNILDASGYYDITIAVDPSNSSIAYAAGKLGDGGTGIIETTNGGASWTSINLDDNGNTPHTDWHAMAFDHNGNLLLASDGGLWRKDADPNNAAGFLWTNLNGNLGTMQLYSLALDPANPTVALEDTQDNGIGLYTGNPVWSMTDSGEGGGVQFDLQNPAIAYHALPLVNVGFANLFRVSTDRGQTWSTAVNGLSNFNFSALQNAQDIHPAFTVAPSNGSEVLLADDNLWITTNAAQSWSQLTTVNTNGWNPDDKPVDTIAIAPSTTNTIYAATGGPFASSSQIFVSTNAGSGNVTWSEIDLPGGSGHVNELVVDPTNSEIAYAVVNTFTGGGGHIFRWANGAWTDISGNLPNEPTNTVAINSTTGALYVGNDTGVYVSTNFTTNSPTWALLAPGMPNAQVLDLQYSAATGLLGAATHGRGAFLISTNSTSLAGAGVFIDASSSGNTLTGNLIGTDHTGTASLPNPNGVVVIGSSNTIGGSAKGAANTIAFNTNDGVLVDTGTNNLISRNSIFSSGNLGIELTNNGNNNQAPPTLTSVTAGKDQTVISGSLTSAANTTYTLEFFANTIANPSGFGEGQTFLGAANVANNANSSQVVDFTVTLSVAIPPAEQVLTATATDPNNNTSPFSNALTTQFLQVQPVAVSATEGSQFSGNVATFTDTDPNVDPTKYTAAINWGDGDKSTGAISGPDGHGVFTVSGADTYADEGKYTLSVVVTDSAGETATASQVVSVNDAALTAGTASATTGTEGVASSTLTATFSDANTAAPTSDFSGTIDWGDNTSSTFTSADVSGSGGALTVTAAHLYAEEGSYPVSITVNDDGGSGTSLNATAAVNDAALSAGTASATTGTEGVASSTLTATFSDANTAAPTSDFSGTIDWGDNTSSTFTAADVSGSGGALTLTAAHLYAEEGSYPVSITVNDDGGSGTSLNATAAVNDAALTAGTASATAGTEGVASSTLTATFSDANTAAPTSDFSGTIDWGDNTSSTFTAADVSGSSGALTVTAAHLYAEEGSYPVSITVNDDGGSGTSLNATAAVNDAALTAGTASATTGTEGVASSTLTATFSDANTAAPTSDFSGTIDWGDNTSSTFTSADVSGSSGAFTVTAAHLYAEEGSYPVSITVNDDGGSGTSLNATAAVNDAALTATGQNVTAPEGHTVSWTMATFTDANPLGTADDYTAVIDWSDGTPATTISGSPQIGETSGVFSVTSSHDYTEEGVYTLSVVISDEGGATTTVHPVATVSDPSVMATPVAIVATEGASTTVNVATFTDPGGAEASGDYSATIDWGDNHSTTGTISPADANGVFTVSGTHLYVEEGTYTASVIISHESALPVTLSTTAKVSDPSVDPTAAAGTIPATAGTSVTANVATFTDPGGPEVVGDYSATIVWGDGHTLPGTISPADSHGVFTVSGMNTYANSGTFTATVTITHEAALAVAVSDTVNVVSASGPTNVTQDVSFSRTGMHYNSALRVFEQTVFITNTSTSALSGPLALVLTNLSNNATLANANGSTGSGNPYINVLKQGSTLPPGKTISIVLEFKDSTFALITYGTQVWENL
jgi:hypothetical protein